ncbi:MAG TPA: hypothetical protein VME46_07880 [Acidimicrobiales bacterium]|nr:hypothetical protein [Acidimicrobiales bacterium]
MTLLLDAGAFVPVERGDRDVVALVKRERLSQRSPLSHGGVVAEIWRSGPNRQAEVARLLGGVEVVALGEELRKKAGVLLGLSGGDDAVDAALICLARDGDDILTSTPETSELWRRQRVYMWNWCPCDGAVEVGVAASAFISR